MDNTMKEDEKTEEEGGWEQVEYLRISACLVKAKGDM